MARHRRLFGKLMARQYQFGEFSLDESRYLLQRGDRVLRLEKRPMELLLLLVERCGELVTRDEIAEKLWGKDVFVDVDHSINTAVRKVRQVLRDDPDKPRYVETVVGKGYRFAEPVICKNGESSTLARIEEIASPALVAPDHTTPKESPSAGVETPLVLSYATRRKEARHNPRRWFWFLAAACALALLTYGAVIASRLKNKTLPLATEQRITSNPQEAPILTAAVSPDGKFLAYSDSTGVYIRLIATGETRPVQLPKDYYPTSWFPDSTNLLLTKWQPNNKEEPSLWRVSILGGGPQKLLDGGWRGIVSPDGARIAFIRHPFSAGEIWVVDTDGANARRVVEHTLTPLSGETGKTTPKQEYLQSFISALAWSPDGSRIAYVRAFGVAVPDPAPGMFYAIETVAIDGGTPKLLRTSTESVQSIYWAADDRVIYPDREDGGSSGENFGIWSIGVNPKTGEPVGEPQQITKGSGQIDWLSASTDGKRLTFLRTATQEEVLLTDIDPKTDIFRNPRRVTLDENASVVSAWTPDSRAVVFVSNRTGAWKLFRQGIDQATAEVLFEGRNIFLSRLSPDGKQILGLTGYAQADPASSISVMAIPLEGGTPREILRGPGIVNIECARSPSKFCLLESIAGTTGQFYLFDPESGEKHEFGTFQGEQGFPLAAALSPDGSQLALCLRCAESKITFMAVADKIPHEVELKHWSLGGGMDWSADSQSLFVGGETADRASVILSVKPSGDVRVVLEGDKGAHYEWVIPSPDGQYGAVRATVTRSNVWMVENF